MFINTYYETSEIDDLLYVMQDVKDDEEKLLELQSTVKNTCYGWVIRYKEEDATSTKDFETITYKYKELIEGLYRYALVKEASSASKRNIYIEDSIVYSEDLKKLVSKLNNANQFYVSDELLSEYSRSVNRRTL